MLVAGLHPQTRRRLTPEGSLWLAGEQAALQLDIPEFLGQLRLVTASFQATGLDAVTWPTVGFTLIFALLREIWDLLFDC